MKTMVFIDFQNFNINMQEYYKKNTQFIKPRISYSKFSKELSNNVHLDNINLIKTYLFGYKPCNELMALTKYSSFYKWLNGMKNKPYIEVIEGLQVIRPINKSVAIDINDSSTYVTEEKGTDVNIAVNMISKAYTNAYDVAILVSGDTDYVPVIKQLHNIGKTVILATFPTQNIAKYEGLYDQHIKIYDALLQKCFAEP